MSFQSGLADELVCRSGLTYCTCLILAAVSMVQELTLS